MTRIGDIKAAIAARDDEERIRLREWLAELDAQRFDERIERGSASGKLDALIDQARQNATAGRRTPI